MPPAFSFCSTNSASSSSSPRCNPNGMTFSSCSSWRKLSSHAAAGNPYLPSASCTKALRRTPITCRRRRNANGTRSPVATREPAFDQPLDQVVQLVRAALNVSLDALPKGLAPAARRAMETAIELGWYGAAPARKALTDAAPALYPLHPTVVPILLRLFSRFGQNEWSLFSFLLSTEPFGIQEFARRPAGATPSTASIICLTTPPPISVIASAFKRTGITGTTSNPWYAVSRKTIPTR